MAARAIGLTSQPPWARMSWVQSASLMLRLTIRMAMKNIAGCPVGPERLDPCESGLQGYASSVHYDTPSCSFGPVVVQL